ncbi:12131_t:CDS:1, partial [Acaulospora colombiana]
MWTPGTRRKILEESFSTLREEFELNPKKPSFKLTYTASKIWPHRESATNILKRSSTNSNSLTTPIRIAILSASFNPPTKAHLQLLIQSAIDVKLDLKRISSTKDVSFFDACLLLYSANNADKLVLPSDAGPIDRLLMMEALAAHINSVHYNEVQNVAVGVCSHGRFLDQAKALLSFFSSSNIGNSNPMNVSLYFLMGFDTIVRFYDPKYYSDIHKELQTFFETSYIICANRDGYGGEKVEEEFFESKTVVDLSGKEKVIRVKLDQEIAKMSSTNVRKFIREECRSDHSDREERIKKIVYEMCPEPVSEFIIEE